MATPQVSVIIPYYNADHTIRDALESLGEQTHPDFEVIIVDDGSLSPLSGEYAIEALNKNCCTVLRTPRRGIIHALNLGLAHCRGQYIARMDADDICDEKRLYAQAAYLDENKELDVCSSLVGVFPSEVVTDGLKNYVSWLNSNINPKDIAADMFVESPVAHPSAMIRKVSLLQVGGYQEHGWPEDYDLWLRMHERGMTISKVPDVLLHWRHTEGRLTYTDSRYSIGNFIKAKAHYLAKRLSVETRNIYVWGTGSNGRRLLTHLRREGISVRAFVDIDADKKKKTLLTVPIIHYSELPGRESSFVLPCVSSANARGLIREQLITMGFVEGKDYVCSA